MKISSRAGLAGLLLSLLLAAPAFAGATVSVRVEGAASTLLPRTPITLTDTPEPQTGCPADSAANALDIATAGNWDHQAFTQTILGETHKFDNNDYWGVWVFRGGTYKVANGICTETLAPGEELLVADQVADPVTFAPTLFPLWLTGIPSTVKPDVPFTVTVNRAACETDFCNPGEGHTVPGAGATVTADGQTFTADNNGVATVTVHSRGNVTLRATQPSGTPSATEATCVSDGADGYCGYVIPPPATDTAGPTAQITGLKRRYKHGKGPRTLTAAVADSGSGVADVKLALTRVRGAKRCAGFGNIKGRFRKIRCGRRLLFSIGAKTDVSFLLPHRLGTGEYLFTVVAIDGAGNRTETIQPFRVK